MMLRYAAVRPDGSIARVVAATSEDVIDLNMPAGAIKVAAPAEVMFGTHTYDFGTETFCPATSVSA